MEHCNQAKYLEDRLDEHLRQIKDERTLKLFAHQILTALSFCHKNGIIHADLKPANLLLCTSESSPDKLKLCDFGVSLIMPEGDCGEFDKAIMKERSGSALYIAPEIKQNNTFVGPEIDMWSFGILLYQMAVAYVPSQVKNYKYGSGPLPFRQRDWKHLSVGIQDLITKCAAFKPGDRLTSVQALNHSWFD